MNIPHLQKKKPRWNILCRIKKDRSNPNEKGFGLSFTTDNIDHFVPPNGIVVGFNLYAELGFDYPKLKIGIYTDRSNSCCLITKTSKGIYLHGISDDLQKLKEVISKILSSAGMRPTVSHKGDTPSVQQLLIEWSEAILSLGKK